jgi:SAM-dependent methyltransferase
VPREDSTADAYDRMAADYDLDLRSNPYDEHLAFPATSGLLSEVTGVDRALDAGCGTGQYAEHLQEAGVEVVGVDASREMLARGREQVPGAEFVHGDLASPLPFDGGAFDLVVSALAMGYLEDWTATLGEFARVLGPGGVLVVSTTHPFDQFHDTDPDADEDRPNYFRVERRVKQWDVPVPHYRRPMSAVVEPLLDAGFRLDRFLEPEPTAGFREAWPERYEKESRFPVFLCLRARLPG